MEQYDDIINLSYPYKKKHPQMSMADRAAQFSPFSALTGYNEAIQEATRITEDKVEISESEKEKINDILLQIENILPNRNIKVRIKYFQKDDVKPGGNYKEIEAEVYRINRYQQKILLYESLKSDSTRHIDAQSGREIQKIMEIYWEDIVDMELLSERIV